MIDPYAELGVTLKADRGVIRRAYLARARQYHPDRGGDADQFNRITQSYQEGMRRAGV